MPTPTRVATVAEVAALYGVDRHTVRAWIAAGHLKARRRSPAPKSNWVVQLPDDAPGGEDTP